VPGWGCLECLESLQEALLLVLLVPGPVPGQGWGLLRVLRLLRVVLLLVLALLLQVP
jgi:hypothetical protein